MLEIWSFVGRGEKKKRKKVAADSALSQLHATLARAKGSKRPYSIETHASVVN